MGKFVKGSKPTRAERKAQKRAAKAAAKQAEFDLKQQAKEEKRASKSGRSLFGFGRKKQEEDETETDFEFGLGGALPGGPEDEAPGEAPSLGSFAADPPASPPEPIREEEIIIDDDIKIIPARTRTGAPTPPPAQPFGGPAQPAAREPLRPAAPLQPEKPAATPNLGDFDISTPEGRAAAKRALEQAEAGANQQARSPRAPAAPDAMPGAGTVIRPKGPGGQPGHPGPQGQSGTPGRGTEIRPARPAAGAGEGASPNTQDSVAQNFAALKDAVDQDQARHVEPIGRRGQAVPPADPEDVFVLDDPITNSPAAAAPFPDPLAGQGSGAAHGDTYSSFPENWLGLWVAEDGQAIFIEDDGDGWHAVSVLQDPTTKCFYGPDYPEIQTFRMPGVYAREAIGDFEGERFSVITVPGLPDDHQSPIMYLYFLTSIPASEGGGNRFATEYDKTNRVFLVADFELGTVNPWSDEDDIDWIDPGVNFYKAPGKLDAYMARRMMSEDPLN